MDKGVSASGHNLPPKLERLMEGDADNDHLPRQIETKGEK